MKRKKEVRLLKKRQLKIIKHFRAFISSKHQDELHRFRVEIKKMKSLISLFSAASNNSALLKKIKPLKKIFKQAGVIRDAFIHLELVKQYHLTQPELENEQQ